MSFDYDRLKELADNAPPGPWTVKEDWGEVIVANECGHEMSWGDQVRFKMEAGNKNFDPHLVALAPDMARELLHLRDGIKEQIDHLRALVMALETVGQLGAAGPVQGIADTLTELIKQEDTP